MTGFWSVTVVLTLSLERLVVEQATHSSHLLVT
jgi:hypothetical protein